MYSKEFTAIKEELKLSNKELSDILLLPLSEVAEFEADVSNIPLFVAKTLRLMQSNKLVRYAFYEGAAQDKLEYETINHPTHYTSHPSGIECIQISEHMPFCIGSAIKYLWRGGLKGSKVEDLKKAAWYINREIERLSSKKENSK
jgi:hypothetical protein